jgi:MOSC domain-containing protein YiiM
VEISQIGKVCHTRCAIYYLAGDCIFPREGIFGVVLEGGQVQVGDPIDVVKMGDGTCEFSPAEAIAEVEEARANGTL